MLVKTNPSMIPRFAGAAGRKHLLTSLCDQQSVAGEKTLARRLMASGSLQEYLPGNQITRQGDADNDMYFIVSGSVSVMINDRDIATRSAGAHVGEMALLDPTARRSATIISLEPTVVLKVSETRITCIARAYPEFWRRLAVALAARLQERTKYIRQPNSEPIVFIGSSSEALCEADYINQALSRDRLVCRQWKQGVFQLSQTTIEGLVGVAQECDFAVLLVTPDDMTTSRRQRHPSPRDNVVFELGLFMGAIGRDRTYIVAPQGTNLRLPTDLLGVTCVLYDRGHAQSLSKMLLPVSRILRRRIRDLRPR